MDASDQQRATECQYSDMDWATIGRRIVRAAAMATAVHVTERGMRSDRGRTHASNTGVQGQTSDDART